MSTGASVVRMDRATRSRVRQQVYLVMIPVRPANPGDANVEVYDAKLTRKGAEDVSREVPGSWVQKIEATK